MQKTTVFFHFLIFVLVSTFSFSSTEAEVLNCACTDGYWQTSQYKFPNGTQTTTQGLGGNFYSGTCYSESLNYWNTYKTESPIPETTSSFYEMDSTWQDCIANPVCDSNQTLDTSVTPPVCLDVLDTDGDGIPDHLDDDDDNDGYPDTEDAFPLDATEHVDSDNDGVGDNTDLFPHDANESIDTDGDGIGDNSDFDDDGDGYSDSQEALDGTDPLDSNSNSSSPSGCSSTCGLDNAGICQDEVSFGSVETPIAVVDYQNCSNCQTITQEFYGMTCSQFFGVDSPLAEEEPIIDSCSHDSERGGFPFQSITLGGTECSYLIYAHAEGGIGQKQTLNNCSEGGTACFYTAKSGDEFDDNLTADINTTSLGDIAIVNKLDEIKEINEGLGLGLNTIDDSINSQTDKLSSKFDMLATSNKDGSSSIVGAVNSSGDGIKTSVDGVKTSVDGLGSKLDGIQGAINSKDEYPMESESNLEFDDAEVDAMTSGYSADINNQFSIFTSAFDGDLFTLQSITLPVSANCGCSDPVIDLNMMGHSFNETVEVCSSLDTLFAVMRPLLWFSFLTSLLFGFFRKD